MLRLNCGPAQWLLGFGFGLLFPGACAGLPEGNCPAGRFALGIDFRNGPLRIINSRSWLARSISVS